MMDMSARAIFDLVMLSVQNPRSAARYILSLGVPGQARWLLALFVSISSVVLTYVGINLLPPAQNAFMMLAMSSPVRTAILQTAFLLITVIGVHRIGRWRGGKGNFADSLLLVGWVQFILLCLQAVQLAALIVLPPLSEVIGIIGLVVSLWMLTHFIAELHGFQSAGRVFVGLIGSVFVAAMAASMVIMLLMGAGG